MNAPAAEAAMPPAAQQGATTPFVDDEPFILASLRRLFRPCGYRVLTATSGSAGLEILEREEVDLIVSDMRMPRMDGAPFLECARAPRLNPLGILLTHCADGSVLLDQDP